MPFTRSSTACGIDCVRLARRNRLGEDIDYKEQPGLVEAECRLIGSRLVLCEAECWLTDCDRKGRGPMNRATYIHGSVARESGRANKRRGGVGAGVIIAPAR